MERRKERKWVVKEREDRKADWRDNKFKEREVRNAVGGVLRDDALTDRIFGIVKAQRGY